MTPKRPVVAIPPSYNQDQSLELDSTSNYRKYLEDNGQFKESQYFMNKFKKQVEKYNNGLVTGARMISSGPNGIR